MASFPNFALIFKSVRDAAAAEISPLPRLDQRSIMLG